MPESLARALRERAARNHRSVQGELMHILETTLQERPFRAGELVRQIQAMGLQTEADGTATIRRDRDRR